MAFVKDFLEKLSTRLTMFDIPVLGCYNIDSTVDTDRRRCTWQMRRGSSFYLRMK